MIEALIVTAIVYAIVGTYMFLVNRLLRSDEHWNEPTVAHAEVVKPRPECVPALVAASRA